MEETTSIHWVRVVFAIGALAVGCASSAATTPAARATVSESGSLVLHRGDCDDWEIRFPTGSADVSPQTREALGGLARCILHGDVREVTVLGSADPRGSARANEELAQRRADAIREILVGYGCAPSVVAAASVGEQGTTGSPRTYSAERRAVIHAHDVIAD